MQYFFESGGRTIPYTLRRSARARQVRLVVWPERGLEVVVPTRFPLRDLPPIFVEKGAWIIAKLDEAARRPQPPAAPPLADGSPILYRGLEYELKIVREARRTVAGALNGATLTLRLPQKAEVRPALEHWYRVQAAALIPTRVVEVASRIGAPPYSGISVRAQKTRWGSCSSRKRLSFNWRLILAPPPALDYVIVHELTHLRHPNHAPAFWQSVAADCPDYTTWRAWLKTNGVRLWAA